MAPRVLQVLLLCILLHNTQTQDRLRKLNLPFRGITISDHDLNVAVKFAEDGVSRMQRLEQSLAGSDIDVDIDSPSHGQLIDAYPTPEALNYGRSAFIANKATLFLVQRHCLRRKLTQVQCLEMIRHWSLRPTPLKRKCDAQYGIVRCNPKSFYRTYDGTCNNILKPNWGQAYSPYKRLLPPQYADGIMEPRKSHKKKALPSAREISNALMNNHNKVDDESTLALVQWTQFIANDLYQTPVSKGVHTGNSIECCRDDGRNLSPRYVHPNCQQIPIQDNDPDYSTLGATCMNYVRSLTSLREDCNFGPADQMNQASHFLDGSMVYGSTPAKALSLRHMSSGRLSTYLINNEEFPPLSASPQSYCQAESNETLCFTSGDSRINLHPHQTVMYTIWIREHNRVARALETINPHWDDEKLYQEARKIVIAQIQHITYKHWAPAILGQDFVESEKLAIKSTHFGVKYNDSIDPRISNSFSVSGLSYVWSMLQHKLGLYTEKRQLDESLALNQHYNNPSIIKKTDMFESLVRGLATQKSQRSDVSFVEDVTSQLYKGDKEFGYDIVSLEIQRGRDHGIPGYSAFRKFCNLQQDGKFDSFLDTISKLNVNKLKFLYTDVNDVDLIVGGLVENTAPGNTKLGATLRCLVAEQLYRTRHGDRFFYDIPDQTHSFTEGQINEVKKSTLSRVFCDNTVNIKQMQLNTFKVPSTTNELLACDDSRLKKIDFNAWKENKI